MTLQKSMLVLYIYVVSLSRCFNSIDYLLVTLLLYYGIFLLLHAWLTRHLTRTVVFLVKIPFSGSNPT